MLIVELNIAGLRLSREWPILSRNGWRSPRFTPRSIQWRIPQLRQTPAA